MEDIAPVLLEQISQDFIRLLGDSKIDGMNYISAADYAEKVGAALAEAFRLNLDPDILPDGKMYWNIADRVIRPMLEQDHKIVSDVAAQVQEALNKAAGLGLKAQHAPLNEDRVSGILNKIASAEHFSDVAWVLGEPIVTFSISVIDDTIKKNVEWHGKAGLQPKIVRKAERKCCSWCSNLAGAYTYPDIPLAVYQKHEYCRCVVDYDPGNGRKQDVHTKEWTETKKDAKIESRKVVGLKSNGVQVQGLSKHVLERLQERNVKIEDIKDALESPLKIGTVKYDQLGRPSVVMVGSNATVAINPETGIITTTYPTHSRTAAKLRDIKKEGDK